MKNEKRLILGLAMALLFGLSGEVFASQAQGTGTGAGNSANMIDINKNGIPDGREDFDNDKVLNKDDADYQKTSSNAKDDDGDGVVNKDDADFLRPSDGTRSGAISASSTKAKAAQANQKNTVQSKKQVLAKKVSGRIILKPEDKGKAFYVNPASGKISSLGRPADAFAVIKKEGIGVSNADFALWNNVAPKSMAGKIVLKVEDKGQAYYVNPDNLELIYLKRPADAFKIMKDLGLGISNNDFSTLIN